MRKPKFSRWSNEELEILKKNYPIGGPKLCKKILKRSVGSISKQANELKLFSGVWRIGKEKRTIKKLDDNKVMAKCKKHGIVVHYDWPRRSLVCSLCSQQRARDFDKTERGKELARIRQRQKMKNPKNRFVRNIRNRLNKCYHGLAVHFKDLGYSSEELKEHLYDIKGQHNNKCQGCFKDYDEVGFTIEHIIPLATAKSKQEIIDLFALSNLSIMCRSCNSSKHSSNLEEWKNRKLLERKAICQI
jgi:hypothetical protein